MKKPFLKSLLFILFFAFLLTASPSVYAQKDKNNNGKGGGNGNGKGGGTGGGNPNGAPIDGGISLLLASGAALGLYSLRKKK